MKTTTEQPYREDYISQDDKLHIVYRQDASHIVEAAKAASESLRKNTGPGAGRFLGTVPLVVAQQWAQECGAGVGTKEWAIYAKKKLRDGTWAKLRVHGQ